QLAVTGKQAADVAVVLGGQHLEIHRIERDEQMIARLIELERRFWQYVETDTPPPADGTASAETALRCLFPTDSGETVDSSGHAGLSAAYIELKALRQSIADKEKREAQLKQMLQQAMGEASRAEFTNGYISWRKAKDSVGFDVARLLQERPHLKAKYSLIKPGARRFLVGLFQPLLRTPSPGPAHAVHAAWLAFFHFQENPHAQRSGYYSAGARTDFHWQGHREE